MALTVRGLTDQDAPAARRLGEEAFGMPLSPPGEPATLSPAGKTWFGGFDGAVLAARMADRAYDSYFGGGTVPTAGIAGVTVAAEYRGQGALGPLFTEVLAAARSRGAVISTLFPTAPRIYRRFGYEVVADLWTVQVPTAQLASVRPDGSVTVRRAGPSDHGSIQELYRRWAEQQNGPLTRRGVSFPESAEVYLAGFTGVTLAEDRLGRPQGYASWRRGQGYGEQAILEISDLLATSAEGYRSLLAAMGSFASVTPNASIETSGADVIRTFLPSLHWQVQHASPYMLKVLDVCAAFSLRAYAAQMSAELEFGVQGDFLADLNGSYRLVVEQGRASCERIEQMEMGARSFSAQGLALAYAGAQSSANLRAAGHLWQGALTEDSTWDALLGGRQVHIRNYF